MLNAFYLWEAHLMQSLGFYKIAPYLKILNALDTIWFYYTFVILVFIFYGKRWGCLSFFMMVSTAVLIWALKNLFQLPRPGFFIPSLTILKMRSYGFPSGTAFNSILIFWLIITINNKSKNSLFFAAFLFLITNLARVILGVHFFSDLIGGWFFGGMFLLLLLRNNFSKKMFGVP
jgi:membrane-associated phospholipid phosphatase